MKMKRDPESMRKMRSTLARSPGWFPRDDELDALSDDQLADVLDRSFEGIQRALPGLREAMNAVTEAWTSAARSFAELNEAHPLQRTDPKT